MTAVRFQHDGYQWAVHFPYDARLVELMKTIPASFRSWDPTARIWRVNDLYGHTLAKSMRELGCTVVGLEPPKPPPPPPPWAKPASPPNWAKLLFARVGDHRAEPVFRALTRVLHPDNAATGDTELQRELNNARDELWSKPREGVK